MDYSKLVVGPNGYPLTVPGKVRDAKGKVIRTVDSSGAFMVGIMSLMDAILDCPMGVVISQLPLTAECKDALGGGQNALGKLLHLAICCERGAWDKISTLAIELGLTEEVVLDLHLEACLWSRQILHENLEPQ